MKITQQLIFIFITLLVLGCEGDTVIGTQRDKVYGSIHGIVTDNNSNTLLQGIEVNWVSNGVANSTLTDANGYYSITDLIPGSYNLTFTGDDTTLAVQYAVIEKEEVVIDKLADLVAGGDYDNEPSGDYYVEVVKDVKMYSMNGSATGYVYLEVDAEETIVGNSVTVIAEYIETLDIKPSQYTAITDAAGNYMFSNIPAAHGVIFKTVQFTNAPYTFDEASATKSLVPGLTVMVDHIIMNQKIASAPVLLSNNFENNDFQIGDNITGTFNEAIDHSDYNFVMTFNNTSGDYAVNWSDDSKIFLITPDEDLALDRMYTFNIAGSTIAGKTFSNSYTFMTQKGIEETSSTLESYDDSGNLIDKDAAISWLFSETLATAEFIFNVHEQGCSNADYSTQNTCLCGNSNDNGGTNGQWDGTNEQCSSGNITGNQWRWSLNDGNGDDNEDNCNITVTQWDNDAKQNLTSCLTSTLSSSNTITTLLAPPSGWGYKLVTDENGVTTATYEDITIHYKYVSTLTTYDYVEATVTIEIDD